MVYKNKIQTAIEIKRNNDISAPINDIIDCIDEVKRTGVDNETSKNMVISMFKNSNPKKYKNLKREPYNNEILLYDIKDDNMVNLINHPE